MFSEELEVTCETFNESTDPSPNSNHSEIVYYGNEKLVFKDGWFYNENNIPLVIIPFSILCKHYQAIGSNNLGEVSYTQPVAFSETNIPQKGEEITKNLKRACLPSGNSSKNDTYYKTKVPFKEIKSEENSQLKQNNLNDPYNKNNKQNRQLLQTKRNVATTTNLKPICSPRDTSTNEKINYTPEQNNSIDDNNHMFSSLPIKIHENVSTNLSPVCVLRENYKKMKLMKGNEIPVQDNFINDNIDNGIANNKQLIKQVSENMDIISNLMPKASINNSNHYATFVPFVQDEGIVDTTSESIHHQNSILPFQQNDNLFIPKEICQSNGTKGISKLIYYDDCDIIKYTNGVFIKYGDDGTKSVSKFTSNSKVESALHCLLNIIKGKKKSKNSTQKRKGVVRNRRSTKIETNTQPSNLQNAKREQRRQ